MKFTRPMSPGITGSPTDALRQQFLSRCLPILGTGGLMCWLSGGFYPRTWQLFFQACTHFSRLQAQWGKEFLFSFAILAVQALLLAIAWGFLLRLIVREGIALFSTWQTRNMPVRVALQSAANKPAAALPASAASLQKKPSAASTNAPGAQRQSIPSPQQNSPAPLRSATVAPRIPSQSLPAWPVATPPVFSPADPELRNPFEEPEPALDIPSWPVATPSDALPKVQRLQRQEEAMTPFVSRFAEKDENKQQSVNELEWPIAIPPSLDEQSEKDGKDNDKVQLFAIAPQNTSADQTRGVEMRDRQAGTVQGQEGEQEQANFSAVLRELGFFHLNQPAGKDQSAPPEPEKQASLPKPSASSADASHAVNPFDVQSDVLHLFSSPDVPAAQKPAKSGPEKKPAPPQAQDRIQVSATDLEAEQVYMLGNPFEGTLPEVFEQDEALKHAVLEQVSEELEQRAKQRTRTTGQSSPTSEKRTTKRGPRKKSDETG